MRDYTGIILAVFFGMAILLDTPALPLTEKGKANAIILLPSKPHKLERQAADELVEHIRLMSGAELKVAAIDGNKEGLLPVYLGYARQALLARKKLVNSIEPTEQMAVDGPDAGNEEIALTYVADADRQRIEASSNPWDFPAKIRDTILRPVREAGIIPPVYCDTALVDAVYMKAPGGIVIPLANYTLAPLKKVRFSVKVDKLPRHIESVYHGKLPFEIRRSKDDMRVDFELPLDSTDYLAIR